MPQQIQTLPLVAPISVMPAPSKTQVAIEAIAQGPDKMILMQFATKHGVQFYFLSTDAALQIAERMKDLAGSGIIVVPAGAMP